MEELFNFYNLFTVILVAIWLIIFFTRKELQRELLILGVFSVFLMPLVFTINQIDANVAGFGFTQVSFVDLVFAFVLAGIAGTIFHAIFGKHYHKLPNKEKKKLSNKDSLAQIWILRLFIIFLLFIWTVVLLNFLFDIAVPQAFLIGSVMVTIYLISHRHDLLIDALWSSFLTGFIVFLSSILASTFTSTTFIISPVTSNVLIAGVPLDLLLWSLAAGLALGPLYEFIRTLELK